MNPKKLLLYAAAQCSGQTALMIMQKERITPKRFEISYSGELSAETVQSGKRIHRSFHVVYNIECDTEDDQAKVGRAVDADTRKVLRHGAMLHDRTRVARNRGGQHPAGESVKPRRQKKRRRILRRFSIAP